MHSPSTIMFTSYRRGIDSLASLQARSDGIGMVVTAGPALGFVDSTKITNQNGAVILCPFCYIKDKLDDVPLARVLKDDYLYL